MTVAELKKILENIEDEKQIYFEGINGYTTNIVIENMPFNVYVMENKEINS